MVLGYTGGNFLPAGFLLAGFAGLRGLQDFDWQNSFAAEAQRSRGYLRKDKRLK